MTFNSAFCCFVVTSINLQISVYYIVHMQFISVVMVFLVGYLSTVYPTSVGWVLVGITGLAAVLSGENINLENYNKMIMITSPNMQYV